MSTAVQLKMLLTPNGKKANNGARDRSRCCCSVVQHTRRNCGQEGPVIARVLRWRRSAAPSPVLAQLFLFGHFLDSLRQHDALVDLVLADVVFMYAGGDLLLAGVVLT